MRTLVKTFSAIALVVATALVPAAAATASKKPAPKAKIAAWAKKNRLTGSWQKKDADRDGLKNLEEFKAKTNPRKPDSDRDGLKDGDELKVGYDPLNPDSDDDDVKDGAEHSGVVTAFDGETITIRQFKGGKLTATLSMDADCFTAEDESAEDAGADDPEDDPEDDGYYGEDPGDDWGDDPGDDGVEAAAATVDIDDTVIELGAEDSSFEDEGEDDAGTCEDAGVEKGALVRSVELERDGGELFAIAVELA